MHDSPLISLSFRGVHAGYPVPVMNTLMLIFSCLSKLAECTRTVFHEEFSFRISMIQGAIGNAPQLVGNPTGIT